MVQLWLKWCVHHVIKRLMAQTPALTVYICPWWVESKFYPPLYDVTVQAIISMGKEKSCKRFTFSVLFVVVIQYNSPV